MFVPTLKKIITTTRTTLDIVLCRNCGRLLIPSLFLLSLPLAHAVGHRAWSGDTFPAHPAAVDGLQILLGYLFALLVTGNTFLAYRILRPLWKLGAFTVQVWRAIFQASQAVRYVDPEARHADGPR